MKFEFFEKLKPQIIKGFLERVNKELIRDLPSKNDKKLRNEVPEWFISKVLLLKDPKEKTLKLPRKKRFLNLALRTAFSNRRLQPISKVKSTESRFDMKFILEKRELQLLDK